MTEPVLDEPAAVDDLGDVRALLAGASAQERLAGVGLREVVWGDDALSALPEVLARLDVPDGATVAVLSDDVPKRCDDHDVLDVVHDGLAGRWAIRPVVLDSPGAADLHADAQTVDTAERSVGDADAAVLVSVGSGTIADIGKVVAQRRDLAHVVVQTAASVNGYADDQSVLLVNGTKRTTPSRWPEALVVDTRVLSSAPVAMTRSGLGDLLSTFTGAADWHLAATVGFDPSYSPTAVAVLRTGIEETLALAPGLRANEPAAVRALARSLTYGGLAMGVAGRTSPSSGAEHTISHLLEMSATALHRNAAHHGAQVGVASVVVARIWTAMRARLSAGECVARPLDPSALHERVHDAFTHLDRSGAMARECWSAYQRKLQWVNEHLEEIQQVCDDWAAHDASIGALLVEPELLSATLRSAGAPVTMTALDPAPAQGTARWAVQNCHLMRDRFTIVDLAEMTGFWTDRDVDDTLSGRTAVTAPARPTVAGP
ncbi:MAG: iron-containing alcohol dehydrogenase [Actinomycetales bacterium]